MGPRHLQALADSRYLPLWLDQGERPSPQAPLAGEERCQLLIVGGGFTGLWGALQAKERRPDLDVILIEATEIGDGASGRNGGFLDSSLAHGSLNTDVHFPGEGDRLEELGHKNLVEFVDSLERHGVEARYEGVGMLTVATNAARAAALRQTYEAEKVEDSDVVWFDEKEVRREIDSPTFFAGRWKRDGKDGLVDPTALCWGLKQTVLSLGVRIFEGTPMRDMSRDGHGMKLTTPEGSIRCNRILMGTNAYPTPISRARRSIIPVWDYALATEPLSREQLASVGWQRRQGLGDHVNMFYYSRLTHDNRITWGGSRSVIYRYGSRIDSRRADDPEIFAALAQQFFETFPQLEGLRFTHRWNGLIASTTRFCMVPGTAFDGRVAWAIGYTGLGVGAARFGARIALELLGYDPTDILDMQFVKKPAMAWPPEPFRWMGVTLTRHEMMRADRNHGRRGLWLKLLDRFNLGFAC
jgi:glycine/D-amino acid oxidase-like deaminating enzyme